MKRATNVIAIALWVLLVTGAAAAGQAELQAASEETVAATPQAVEVGWTYEGCFAYFAAGPCYDAYRDIDGDLWICSLCGTTKNPSEQTCSPLYAFGFWCS
jgi:hypothetical protein